MPRSGEYPWQGERRLGFPGYADAGVSLVFENLEAGPTIDEIMEWFHLTREQIVTVLEFAARSLDPFPPPRAVTTLR
jgi:hypothetical protein